MAGDDALRRALDRVAVLTGVMVSLIVLGNRSVSH
jgi:hypothetical protein